MASRPTLELKDDEFNAHGVELGHRYGSCAVVPDGTPEPPYTRQPRAPRRVSEQLGVEIAAYVIGPGGEYTDLYDDWARLREVAEGGCVLVRPDAHVAWRAVTLADDPAAELRSALDSILDREPGPEPVQTARLWPCPVKTAKRSHSPQ